MTGLLRTAVALGAALMMSLSPAMAKQDLGVYQTTDRKMDFQLSTCGSGDDLCVRLLDARGSAKTSQTRKFIGKLVVNKAKATGKNAWRGTMRFDKYDLSGAMKLSPGKEFLLEGCVYFVICENVRLIPAK